MTISQIIAENDRRNALRDTPYDPLTGLGCCGDRVQCGDLWLPAALLREHPECASMQGVELGRLRVAYDFEFWAATCATIKDKLSGRNIRFTLNRPQRRMLSEMEARRVDGQPVRVILLKARQWGGSTLVQMYMAWIQIVIHKQWNSLICGHLRQTSAAIKRMYNTLLRNYPPEYLDHGVKLCFRTLEGSSAVQQLQGRDCLLILGSARSEDAVRGFDLAMAHLTEVAFWPSSTNFSPQEVVRSVAGTVSLVPDTVVVYESTANGVGNFFHDEWLRTQAGNSDKLAIFVPWHEIEIYTQPVDDVQALWHSLDDYERRLWDNGVTLEAIHWYHNKRREYMTHSLMMAEFPTTDIEAFVCSGNSVFDQDSLHAFASDIFIPAISGDVDEWDNQVRFYHDANGLLKVWQQPEDTAQPRRYMVVVDVGGRSDKADYSVIMVMDTHTEAPGMRRPEVVAQWRGHIDHDRLAWKAMHIARYYCNALLVIESNTLETEYSDADAGEFILNTLGRKYKNLYRRANGKPGFQTNRHTKQQAVYALIRAVREKLYVEHDGEAINEMTTYEQLDRGRFEAQKGHHDDIVMTRAIAMAVLDEMTRKRLTTLHGVDRSLFTISF